MLIGAAVLSGNRNFEGYRGLGSGRAGQLPGLAAAGGGRLCALPVLATMDLTTEPLGEGPGDGKPVFLRDIWPTNAEIDRFIAENVTRELSFARKYADVFGRRELAERCPGAGKARLYAWGRTSRPMCRNLAPRRSMGARLGAIGKIEGVSRARLATRSPPTRSRRAGLRLAFPPAVRHNSDR